MQVFKNVNKHFMYKNVAKQIFSKPRTPMKRIHLLEDIFNSKCNKTFFNTSLISDFIEFHKFFYKIFWPWDFLTLKYWSYRWDWNSIRTLINCKIFYQLEQNFYICFFLYMIIIKAFHLARSKKVNLFPL